MSAIRRATRNDLRHIGRLGALLVAAHHEFDSRRFLAATSGTKDGYLSTAEHNEGAQRFFASVGFRRTMVEMTREL